MWWLGDGLNLVLHLKLMPEGDVTRRTVMVQDPIVSPFFKLCLLNGSPQMFQNFNVNSRIHNVSPAGANSWCTTPKFLKKGISLR
jgi:hypothetical protein